MLILYLELSNSIQKRVYNTSKFDENPNLYGGFIKEPNYPWNARYITLPDGKKVKIMQLYPIFYGDL